MRSIPHTFHPYKFSICPIWPLSSRVLPSRMLWTLTWTILFPPCYCCCWHIFWIFPTVFFLRSSLSLSFSAILCAFFVPNFLNTHYIWNGIIRFLLFYFVVRFKAISRTVNSFYFSICVCVYVCILCVHSTIKNRSIEYCSPFGRWLFFFSLSRFSQYNFSSYCYYSVVLLLYSLFLLR